MNQNYLEDYHKIHAETCKLLNLIPEDIRLAREVSNYKFTPEIVKKELLKAAKKVKVQIRSEEEALRDQKQLQELIESKLLENEKEKRLKANRRTRLAKKTAIITNITVSNIDAAPASPSPSNLSRRSRLNLELAEAERRQKELNELRNKNPENYRDAKLDLALKKLQGRKICDDPAKLKKSLKELDSKKKKAARNAKETEKRLEAQKRAAFEEKIAKKEKRLDEKATKILQKKGIEVAKNSKEDLPVAKRFTRKERHEFGEKVAKLKNKNNAEKTEKNENERKK